MSGFWLITNVFLDVFPWIFLLYMLFKDRLRFSVITTGVLNYIALTIYLLIFKKITTAEFYNLDVMFSYRVVQIFVVLRFSDIRKKGGCLWEKSRVIT